MAGESKEKKTLYHGAAVTASPMHCTIESEPLESKFKKGSYYVNLKVDGKDRQYVVENDRCKAALTGHKGQKAMLEFSGSRDDASIKVLGAGQAQGGNPQQENASKPQERRGSSPPPNEHDENERAPRQDRQHRRQEQETEHQKTDEELRQEAERLTKNAERTIARRTHLMYRCLMGAFYAAQQAHIASGGELQLDSEAVQKVGVSLYMDNVREGLHHHLSVAFKGTPPQKQEAAK